MAGTLVFLHINASAQYMINGKEDVNQGVPHLACI